MKQPVLINLLFIAYLAQRSTALPLPLGDVYTDFAHWLLGAVDEDAEPFASRVAIPPFVRDGAEKLDEYYAGTESKWPLSFDSIADALSSTFDPFSLKDISSRIVAHLTTATATSEISMEENAAAEEKQTATPSQNPPTTSISIDHEAKKISPSTSLDELPLDEYEPEPVASAQQGQHTLPSPPASAPASTLAFPILPSLTTAPAPPTLLSSHRASAPYLVAGNVGVAAALASLLVLAGIRGLRSRRRVTSTTAAMHDGEGDEEEKNVDLEANLVDLQTHLIDTVDPAILSNAAVAALVAASMSKSDMLSDNGGDGVVFPVLGEKNATGKVEEGAKDADTRMDGKDVLKPLRCETSLADGCATNVTAPSSPTITSSCSTSYLSVPSASTSLSRAPSPEPHIIGAMPTSPSLSTLTSLPPSSSSPIPLSLLIPTHQWLLHFLVILFSWSSFFPASAPRLGEGVVAMMGRRRRGGEFGVIA